MAHPYTHEELVSYCLEELPSEKANAITKARLIDHQLDAQIHDLEQVIQLSKQEAIEAPSTDAALSRFKENQHIGPRRTYRLAAAFIGLLLLSSLSLLFIHEDSKSIVLHAEEQMESYELPDGSHITLSPGSSIAYKENFGQDRSIKLLQGKAFFDVVKQSGAPFLVHAGDSKVEVLGTRFDVALEPEKTSVNLQEGSVAFTCPAGELLLEPMQQALLANNTLHLNKNLAANTFHWTSHQLQFNETPLTEIADLLQDRFNEKVLVSEASNNCTLTGSFSEEKLEDILEVIAITINGDVSTTPTGFFIESPGC